MASQYDLPYTGPQVETLLAKISELESEMPSKTSDLTNDSGFITSADVPTKTSDLNNDSGFITNAPVAAEAARAQAAEALLATISSLQAEISRATGVEGTLQNLIDGIAAKIPSAATAQNQLADKAFVNSSIATSTAEFRGTYNSVAELQAVSADENDYGYVRTTDAAGNTVFKRYKYASGSWVFEYDLNNSSFTASQWAAINSAITAELVEKLRALPTNAALTELLNGKQGVIPDLDTIRSNAAAGGTAYQKPAGGIPKSDMADGVIPDIADNLTTNDATKVLSAKQGKVLSEQVTQLDQELEELDRLVSSGSRVISYVDNEYVNATNGLFVKFPGWSRTNYLYVKGLSTLDFNNPGASSIYNAFYDEGRRFISSFSTLSNYSGSVPVPENASWAVFSNASSDLRQLTISNLPVRMGLDELSENVIAINDEITQLGQEVGDLTHSDFTIHRGWMSSESGAYTENNENGYVVISVRQNASFRLTKTGTFVTQYAFLASYEGTPTSGFDIVGTRQSITGAVAEGTIPANARYIYILAKYRSNILPFPNIEIDGIIINEELDREIMQVGDLLKKKLRIDDVKTEIISDNIADPALVEDGKLINSSGAIVSNANWSLVKVKVEGGKTYTFGGFYLGRNGYAAFYDASNTKIGTLVEFTDPNGRNTPKVVTAPDNAVWLYIDIKSNSSPTDPYAQLQVNEGATFKEYDEYSMKVTEILGNGLYMEDGKVREDISLINSKLDGRTLEVSFPNSRYINSSGELVNSSAYSTSDLIPVETGQLIDTTSYGSSSVLVLAGYDGAGQFVNGPFNKIGADGNTVLYKVVPNSVKYIRICKNNSFTDAISISYNGIEQDTTRQGIFVENGYNFRRSFTNYRFTSPRKACVSFQIDCGGFARSTVKAFASKLAEYGIMESVYVVLPEYLASYGNTMLELYYAGNEIALHTDNSHANIGDSSTLTVAEFNELMAQYHKEMNNAGFEYTGCVVLRTNLKSDFRTEIVKHHNWTIAGNVDFNAIDNNYANAKMNLQSDYRFPKRIGIELTQEQYADPDNETLVATRVNECIDDVIANGGFLIIYGHSYMSDSANYTIRENSLVQILQHLQQKVQEGLCLVGNTSELLEYFYSPRINDSV